MLTVFLFTLGMSRLTYAWKCWRRGWRWGLMLLGGVINVLLGGLILYGWPTTAL